MVPSSHVGFADESNWNTGRHRAIALLSVRRDAATALHRLIVDLLRASEVTEYSWKKTRTAKYRFAAVKLLDAVFPAIANGDARVDVLVWDTRDPRHSVTGRDDVANLHRMYFHLFRNVLARRWPAACTWRLLSDEHSAMHWDSVEDFLRMRSVSVASELGIPAADLQASGSFGVLIKRHFRVVDAIGCSSREIVLCQVADMFAGIGTFATESMRRYHAWSASQGYGSALFDAADTNYNPTQRERFAVVGHLLECIARYGVCSHLESGSCLRTRNPIDPVNFWHYESQFPSDRAPTKP